MDDDQIMIPGNIYQLWLQDASSIISKRGRRNKSLNQVLNTKIANLIEIPPVALLSGQMSTDDPCYSVSLLKLWRKCTQMSPANGQISPDSREKPASQSHSPPQGLSHRTVPSFAPGDFQSEVGSQTIASSVEKFRPGQGNMDPHNEAVSGDHFDLPTSPAGQSSKSAPSSGSGHTLVISPEVLLPTSTRKNYKRLSSARESMIESVKANVMKNLQEEMRANVSDELRAEIRKSMEDDIRNDLTMQIQGQFNVIFQARMAAFLGSSSQSANISVPTNTRARNSGH